MHMTTSPPRERGRRGHRSSEEEFVLYLQGIPQHCRWQELKDFVRQTALHIRQAVVYDDQHGYPTGLGQIIVKNEDEAWRTYHRKAFYNGMGWPPLNRDFGQSKFSYETNSWSYEKFVGLGSYIAARREGCQEFCCEDSDAGIACYYGYITPCTPTRHSHGHLQGFSPMMESPGGYGHHHHHTSAGWNVYPDGLGMLTFPSPAITMFPPPPMEQQQIEYPYYFPYSHPMQIPVRGQPMYTETRYPDYHQQQGGPSAFFSQFPPAPSQYYYHHQQQGYHVYGYESRKPSFHSSSTSEIYPNTAAAPYSNEGGINPHQALPQGIRHIIIDNICPGVDIQTLQDHFRDAGHMLHCQIIRDNENGHEARCNELSYPGQCYATATFSTAEEAERAVGMYNGSDLGGSRVVVRLDTEYDPSTAEDSNVNGDGGGVIFIVVYGFVKSAVSVICVVVDGYDFGDIFSVFWIAKLAIIEHSSYEQDIPVPQPSATSR
ncbi:RNA binding protein [Talaromyces marneffei ATCC 18224]|uniref:RNA binding protein n=1 Tax=Talaromyces marneffei (strain ATCC 18224 / CBS 334.59 / QM 7333) TaxID=441960 RepID=B6QMR0_TALMQ|nr:RNA binding protein [Talaromyces marneffei ATCC 18224]